MYNKLDKKIEQKIINDRKKGVTHFKTRDDDAIREDETRDKPTLIRPPYVRDVEKIMNLPSYNRLQDKTQVFSLHTNDDISHRLLHVQLVSRIARDISVALGLNADLTEAIAVGHDIGHTPFGHAGEKILNELSLETSDHGFNHNVQSVRILTKIYKRNISLQTLDGILCHNGELLQKEYTPTCISNFANLYERMENCNRLGYEYIKKLVPCTLEGCVVRISDVLAYLGKDIQDAQKLELISKSQFSVSTNAKIINNLSVDIVQNSYGKNYLTMSDEAFNLLQKSKEDNYKLIYLSKDVKEAYDTSISPMFRELYYYLLNDFNKNGQKSFIYEHHIKYVQEYNANYTAANNTPTQLVCDFIASMTDDYFVACYKHLLNGKYDIKYVPYF